MVMMVLVAGPYRSATNDDPVLIEANMRAMNEAALALVRAGCLGMVSIARANGKRVFYSVDEVALQSAAVDHDDTVAGGPKIGGTAAQPD